jgi:TatD DNase family protein
VTESVGEHGRDEAAEPEARASLVGWIDSHAHLTAREFDADRAAMLERAWAAGVETIVAIGAGYGVEHNAHAPALAATHPRVVATVGVHPHDAADWGEQACARVRAWLTLPRVVAVGECGLDYHYMRAPREVQRRAFAEQVSLAREKALPVSIHVRGDDAGAYDDLLEIWQSEGQGEVEGVLHCYTGTLEFARRAIAQQLLVSFSGILTFKRDRGLREVAAKLPLSALLVETDSPLLAPEGFRGRRNEPCHVGRVGEVLAAVKSVAVSEVATATAANARRLFRLPEGAAP